MRRNNFSLLQVFFLIQKNKFAVQVFYQCQDLGGEGRIEDSKISKLNASFLTRVFRIHSLSHRSERLKITVPLETSPWAVLFPGIL